MTYKCSALILTGKPEVTWDIEVLYKIIFHSNNLQFKNLKNKNILFTNILLQTSAVIKAICFVSFGRKVSKVQKFNAMLMFFPDS